MASRWLKSLVAVVMGAILCAASWASEGPGYHLAKRFQIGGDGGWDYVTFDADANRLFVTRSSHVMVVDATTGKILGDIPNTSGVHGVALASEFHLGALTNGKGGTVAIFDLKTLKKKAEVKAGENPDAILFDPASRHVFAFNGRSHNATVIDIRKPSAVATITLDGKPEFGVSDQRGHVFVNIEDKSEIAEIDSRSNKVIATWPLTGCEDPTGLAIDRTNQRLFAVCSNEKMAVVDATSGQMVGTVPIGKHPDAAEYDPETHLVFSSNGEGTLTVIQQDAANKYTVAQVVPTAPGARTMALDSRSHTIYLITAGAHSFEVLVVSPTK